MDKHNDSVPNRVLLGPMRKKWEDNGENYITRNFMIHIFLKYY
jgi:hypothetical protein